jgi:hypothetical protein
MLLVARITATSTVDCKDDGNMRTFLCCIARSNNNKPWLIAMKAHVPRNNQPNLKLHHKSKQQLRNENMVNAMIMSYVMLQEAMAMATTVGKQQTTFSINMNQPH